MSNPFKRMKKANKIKHHIGEIRKSQIISTYGIGSIVDFVRETAVIGGVDDWDKDDGWENRQLTNENLQSFTGAKYFLSPKVSGGASYLLSNQDILSYVFPQKLYCPVCKSIIDYRELTNQSNKQKCNQYGKNGKPCNGQLVASRFVLICENGHMEDFPYSWWVHSGKPCKSGKSVPRVKMYNIGGRSDTESLILECAECGEKRSMVGVFNKNAFAGENGRPCCGKHPHLGDFTQECTAVPTTRLRASSGIYFPVTQSALLIPPWSQRAIHQIEKEYERLSYMTNEKQVEYIKNCILPKCPYLGLDNLLDAYETLKNRRKSNMIRIEADVYADEYKILCKDKISEDRYSSHFVNIPNDFKEYFDIESVVDRLVVTMTLSGFTRLYPYDGKNSERIAPLSLEKKEWLPATELNGEGIFIKFKKSVIDRWIRRIGSRYDELKISHQNSFFKSPKFSPQYILLHTFAHLFIRQLANECGYSAASMREKIYSTFTDGTNDTVMNGVLIYLSSSDSDGSLGGLISVAEDTELLDKVLKNMLKEARWCSGDPLCSTSMHQGFASLNYAACHACTLLPETSCEFRNVLLDRVSVVGMPDNLQLGFMGELANKL